MGLSTIESAIDAIREGGIVIVVDDEDRENEGDFIMGAEKCTPEAMNFIIKHGRGVPCVPTTSKRLLELNLPEMVTTNTTTHGTPMHVTVDAVKDCTTGISAYDRARTVQVFVDPNAVPSDLARPGHIIPLHATEGGVLRRAGHTEATVDLATMAGLYPAGVLCEIMSDDGTMARLPELEQVAAKFEMPIISIADLIRYRRRKEQLVRRVATTNLPTKHYGNLTVHAYEADVEPYHVVAFVKGTIDPEKPVLTRVHSSCVTGDLIDSLRCDCGSQLHLALERMTEAGSGVLIYLAQEGRGIGLLNKIKAYELQEKGADTVTANEMLGFKPDLRDYGVGAQVMVDLGLKKVRFMTNNPTKVAALEGWGLEIVWEPIHGETNPHNAAYLKTKVEKMGHIMPKVA